MMNSGSQKLQMFRDEKMPKLLLKMGIPTMIGMLSSALYNLVDAYFVGGLGTRQMGAVSVVFPLSLFFIGLALTFGSGAGSYISRLLGKEDHEQANKTASTALLSSVFIGIIVIIGTLCFLDKILIGLGATETMLPYARSYAIIFLPGVILNVVNVTMNNIANSEGRTNLSMIAMLIGTGLNAVLDPIFIYTFDLGIEGAAIATVIAQAVSVLLYLWYIRFRKGYVRISIRSFSLDRTIFAEIFKVGIPTFIYQLLASLSISFMNSAASSYGDSAVAAIGIVTRIFSMGTYVVFGFMKGFQPVAGYNYGAKNYTRLWESIKLSLIWSTAFCLITAIGMFVFAKPVVSAFNKDDVTVIDIGCKMLKANSVMFVFFGFQMTCTILFMALGKAKQGGILSFSRQGLFFLPTILVLPRIIGLDGIIYTQVVADILTVIVCAIFITFLKKEFTGLKSPGTDKFHENDDMGSINENEDGSGHRGLPDSGTC
jgi:putative MATE family efflux protein